MKKAIRPDDAVAEEIAAEETARFFQERRARAAFEAFDRIMKRKGGTPPVEVDELPSTG